MGGKTPSPVIVIIDSRKIVVDQRMGMDHLDRRHKRLRQTLVPAEQAAGFQKKYGAQTFSSGAHTVVHGFRHGSGKSCFLRQPAADHLFRFLRSRSITGRSSWISEWVWIISIAAIKGSARLSSPPNRRQVSRRSMGRRRFPPAHIL